MRQTHVDTTDYFKLCPYASPSDDMPFHQLGRLPNMEGWMNDYPEQYDWLAQTKRVASKWRPLPSLVQKGTMTPGVFVHGSSYTVMFAKAHTAKLSKLFPNQFEWLAVTVRGQERPDFEPPFVSPLSKKVAALNLHIMHCTRPVLLAEEAEVEEFEPRGKKKKRAVRSFLSVESYAFKRKEVAGLDVFFVRQDLAMLCTRRFRDTLKDLKLTGLQFDPVRVVLV